MSLFYTNIFKFYLQSRLQIKIIPLFYKGIFAFYLQIQGFLEVEETQRHFLVKQRRKHAIYAEEFCILKVRTVA